MPIVLMIAGALIGAGVGGYHAGVVGLIAEFVLGLVMASGMFWGPARIERR